MCVVTHEGLRMRCTPDAVLGIDLLPLQPDTKMDYAGAYHIYLPEV